MMKRISNRPQRYEECVIREGDINMLREDMTQFSEMPRLPVRAVLNMKTFTLFESDKFDSVIAGFNLEDSYIRDYPKDPKNCFIISSKTHKRDRAVLCGF